MRTVRFTPYRRGTGQPTFHLDMYYLGLDRIGYEFYQHDKEEEVRLIFSGDDFRPSPIDAVDGDEAVKALMTFLTLRVGDTDPEYFANDTPEQAEFRDTHAESLSMEVYARFGD